jgi:type I restriction enzyme, R subunit
MNEAETRAELIDPKLKACGWGVVEGSKILRERQAQITDGKINVGGARSKPMKAMNCPLVKVWPKPNYMPKN